MISVNDFKTGLTIKYNGNLYQVMEFQHVKPGKGSAFVRSKLRNLKTMSIQDITFNAGEKVQKAQIDKKNMQFLYLEGSTYNFMDTTTYEQLGVDAEVIGDAKKYLVENLIITLVMNEGEIIGVNLPEKMEIEVTDCEPAIKGDTKSGGDKNATLETGVDIRVPLFIEPGEKIIINTTTGQYVSRA